VYEGIGRYDDALAQHAAIIASPQVEIDIARRAHRKRGSVHEKQGQYSLALDELNRAMELARSGAPISPLALPRTYADFALVRQRLGEYDEAITACEAGLASLRQEGRTRWDDLTEADLHSVLGGIYGMRGDYPRCQYHFERCLQAREIADDLSGVCAVQSNLGYLAQLQSQYEQALEHYRIAEELANKLPLLYVQVVVGVNAADALISLSRYAEAEQRCQAALVLAEQIDAKHMAAQIHHTLGIAFYQQGRYDAALSAFGEALRIQRELGNSYEEANTAIHQALVLSAIERFPEAHEAAQHALARAEELQSQRLKPEALIALAEALLGLAQYEQAEHHARTAADLAEQIGSQHDSGVALRLFGRASMLRGGEFQISFERSEQLLSTINHRFELARTWADYGQALHNSGNLSLGDTYLQRARKTFEAIGAYGELRRLPF
jgi:tetratricopeptide (TPR) repeat protein